LSRLPPVRGLLLEVRDELLLVFPPAPALLLSDALLFPLSPALLSLEAGLPLVGRSELHSGNELPQAVREALPLAIGPPLPEACPLQSVDPERKPA
ncbi:MAG: hypothetical protein ACE5FG_15555, partial [Myxococcota bacterium]